MAATIDFRERCAAALTHPATLCALGLFLLNDLALKPAWPDAWLTGKLSDLAFVVVASPLLAFFLSILVRGSGRGARLAFATAYLGLPLLYAAFNTFATVHDPIVGALSGMNGGSTQSPLDATDSLVIPPGVALALWVWRRPGSAARRRHSVLIVAGLAAIASIATSPPPTERGVWFDRDSVETPRGVYSVSGHHILHDGEVVYSTDYLLEDENIWVQIRGTTHLEHRVLTTAPTGIAFDDTTGNVLVGMGILGALVGTPDGRWAPQAYRGYGPADFSSRARLRALLADVPFWTLAIALAVSALVVAVLIADFRVQSWWMVPVGLLLSVIPAVSFYLFVGAPLGGPNLFDAQSAVLARAILVAPFAVTIMVLADRDPTARSVLMHTLGAAALVATGFSLQAFASYPDALYTDDLVLAGIGSYRPEERLILDADGATLGLAMTSIVLATATLAGARGRIEYWRSVGGATLAALALTFLAFMWWLQLDAALEFTKTAGVVLVTLVAITTGLHLRRRDRLTDAAGGGSES